MITLLPLSLHTGRCFHCRSVLMLGPFNDIEDEQEDDEYLQQAALAATLLLGAEEA